MNRATVKMALSALGFLLAPVVALGLVFGFRLGFTLLFMSPVVGAVLAGVGCTLVALFVVVGIWQLVEESKREERHYWQNRLYTYQRLLRLYGLLHKLPPAEHQLARHDLGIDEEEGGEQPDSVRRLSADA